MTQPWQPASEAELLMHHALLRRHLQRFFQLVVESPLYVPAVTSGPRRLVTWERGDRTHVLAFTSPDPIPRVVGTEADTVLQVDYPTLVRDWPDVGWWLALNPSLPIDATLPVTDVVQVATGELDLPDSVEPSKQFLDDVPANEWEHHLAGALAIRNSALILDLLVLADVLLPTLRPVTEAALDDPYFPWAAMPFVPELPVDEPTIGVFSSEQRLLDAAPGASVSTVRTSMLDLARSWPQGHTLLVNPHTSLEVRMPGAQVAGLEEWARVSELYYERVPD